MARMTDTEVQDRITDSGDLIAGAMLLVARGLNHIASSIDDHTRAVEKHAAETAGVAHQLKSLGDLEVSVAQVAQEMRDAA